MNLSQAPIPFRVRRASLAGRLCLAGLALVAAPTPADAQCEREEQQVLLPAVVKTGDIFGGAVEMDGDVALVANEWDDDFGTNSGSAFFYRHDGTQWQEEQQVFAADAQAGDNFGRSVDIQGNVGVVGAHWDDTKDGKDAGSVYVFEFDGTTWNQVQKLRASNGGAGDRFGATLGLDGNLLVVGAWMADNARGTNAGAAYVFRHDGTRWVEEQFLVGNDTAAGDNFGRFAVVDNDVVSFGAWKDRDSGPDTGSAYVFRHDGTSWVQEQKLLASDRASGDNFGWEGAILDDVLVIGSWYDDLTAADEGSAYVFRHDGTAWVQEQKLTASDALQGDNFGACISLHGNRLLVGANLGDGNSTDSGAAYLFEYKGTTWVQEAKLTSSTGGTGDSFGLWLAVDGDRALVGAWADDDSGTDSGTTFAYDLQDLTLDTDKDSVSQGDSLSLSTCGGLPSAGYLLSVVDINGSPTFLLLAIRSFDGLGQDSLGGTTPPGLAGSVVSFLSLGFDQVGELGLSNRAAVNFL